MKLAVLHRKIGENEEAIDTLKEAVRNNPEKHSLKIRLAEWLGQEERWEEALEYMPDPDDQPVLRKNWPYLMALSAVHLELENYDKAEELLNQASVMEPDNAKIKSLMTSLKEEKQEANGINTGYLAQIYYEQGASSKALRMCRRVLRENAKDDRARELMKKLNVSRT